MSAGGERIGSSKMLRNSGIPSQVNVIDRGTTSVFDRGPISGFMCPRLAKARITQTVCIFDRLAVSNIPSHFVARIDEDTIRVQECRVRDLPLLSSGPAFADMIGLEILFRVRASKKFCDRVARSEVPEEKIKLPAGVVLEPGVRFEIPFIEASTKWDDIDDYLSDEQAAQLAGLTQVEQWQLFDMVAVAGQSLDRLFESLGFELDDGKFEVARRFDTGTFVLIDAVSLDELGVRKGQEYYGKNLIRDHYRSNESDWYAALMRAQSEHPNNPSRWPGYPPLPQELMDTHVGRYEEIADLLHAL